MTLNIGNLYFEGMINQIYHMNYSLIKPTTQIPKPHFIFTSFYCNWICFCLFFLKCMKRDDFDFDIVNFPFLDDAVPRRTSYDVYI